MGTLSGLTFFKRGCTRKLTLLPSILVVGVVSSLLFPRPGFAHLNLSKQCGELTCQAHEYCREFDHTCNPCTSICKEGSNNFSKDTCETGCQDYLHDERYIKIDNNSGGEDIASLYRSLQRDIFVLKVLVGVCLVVIALILAAFIAFITYFWRSIHPNGGLSSSKSGSGDAQKNKPETENKNDEKMKAMELPVIYDNKYGICHSPGSPRRRGIGAEQTNNVDTGSQRQSPSKVSETETMNSVNSAKSNGARTMSTVVNSSSGTTTPNGINNNRFRREPSESTIPEYIACGNDNASLSPSHGGQGIYTHHV